MTQINNAQRNTAASQFIQPHPNTSSYQLKGAETLTQINIAQRNTAPS